MSKLFRRLMLIAVALLGFALLLPATGEAQGDSPEIAVIDADGMVIVPYGQYIIRGIEEADTRNSDAILLVLDTPGGALNVTFEIVQAIRNSDVPVIVYIGPPGAGAASAGLLITLSGHVAVMAPDTAIGASSPIDGFTGEDLESTADTKAREFLSAEARALAQRRGEAAVQIANDAVNNARAVSFQEAVDANLVDFIAADVDEVLEQTDGMEVEVNGQTHLLRTANADLYTIEMSALEELLMLVTNPNVLSLLLILGPLLLIVEIRTPGGWVAGVLGTVCMAFALYGLGVVPVNWLGIIFVGIAIVMFILEVTTPTSGIMAAVGVLAIIIGIVILFSSPGVEPFGGLSIPLVIVYGLVIGGMFAGFAILVVRGQMRQITTGYEGLVGETAVVSRDLIPVGSVRLAGERWSAVSEDGSTIPEGAEVEVVRAERMRVYVRRRS